MFEYSLLIVEFITVLIENKIEGKRRRGKPRIAFSKQLKNIVSQLL